VGAERAEEAGGSPDLSAARRALEAERRRLEAVADDVPAPAVGGDDDSGSGPELSGVDQHPADTGTETQNQEQNLAVGESIRDALAEVDAAFARIDDGTYGLCTACGRPIAAARLEALPATRFCLDDAVQAEVEVEHGARRAAPDDVA
jgi:DnaK suppressor protein